MTKKEKKPIRKRKPVAVIYVYESGLVLHDIDKCVETRQQHEWICDRLEQAIGDILNNGKTS